MARSTTAGASGTNSDARRRSAPAKPPGSDLGPAENTLDTETPAATVLRVTVNLSARGTDALRSIVNLTGDSKTEAINKALQAYALIQQAQDQGGGCWLQDTAEAKPVQTRFY